MLDLRPATLEDAELLLAWRNDPLTRAMSKSNEEIHWREHIKWLTARLAQKTPHLYIAEHFGLPVGTIRIDGDKVSFTVDPEHRGRGYAKDMLAIARERFGSLRAEIKAENIASIRAAEAAGHKVDLIS